MSDQLKAMSAVTWFEIPCAELDRAQRFYETVLGSTMKMEDFGEPDDLMCVFPAQRPGVAGALVKRAFQKPSDQGTMVYLNCNGILDDAIGRVEGAGGSIILPKTAVPGGFGHFACLRDCEGNHVGLHSS